MSEGEVGGGFYVTANSFVCGGIYFCLLAQDWIKDDKTRIKGRLSGHEEFLEKVVYFQTINLSKKKAF